MGSGRETVSLGIGGVPRDEWPRGPMALGAAASLGQIYHAQEKFDEAEQTFKPAEENYARIPGPKSEPRTIALCSLVRITESKAGWARQKRLRTKQQPREDMASMRIKSPARRFC